MTSANQGERIQKVLSHAGVASRREGERLLEQGRIQVNGTVVRQPGLRVTARDHIQVDGRPVDRGQSPRHLLMYKPRGCVTTLSDPQGRATVADCLPPGQTRVFPVGRLDYDSEGLLIFTNDGELAQALMRPQTHVPKTYLTKVRGRVEAAALARLRRPFRLEGRLTRPAMVEIEHRTRHTTLRITLTEGRKHQVREMCRRVDHPVLRLRRVTYGPLHDPTLRPGQTRPLTSQEVQSLREMTGLSEKGVRK
jgi:pseudouridine synthase